MPSEANLQLARQMGEFYDDPLGFVYYAFPWGEGDLGRAAPREWQKQRLIEIGEDVRDRRFDGVNAVDPIQHAVSSGHGIGKSALTAWIILWIMSTRVDAKGIVTANTSDQLKTKTWAELGKWLKKCITGHWFNYSSGRGSMSLTSRERPETWRCDAQTCKEENSESFAGLHAANSTPFYIFDEASSVPDAIWEVSDGGLTDGEPMRFVFGNPTRNTGRFFRCFGVDRHRWKRIRIDSRDVEGTNKRLFEQWKEDSGEDSDFFRVRVRGLHPRAGSTQFIANSTVDAAVARSLPADTYAHATTVLGVDVARHGDDRSAIAMRQGAKLLWIRFYRIDDLMKLADVASDTIKTEKPDAVFVDAGGMGAGVYDRIRQLGHPVIPVQFGEAASQDNRYFNKRSEIWGEMREWLKIADIPEIMELREDLTAPEYEHDPRERLKLESKKDIKKRGLDSPDGGDAIAVTFAAPVAVGTTSNRLSSRRRRSSRVV